MTTSSTRTATVTIDPADAARASRAPVRRRRSHAAIGSRVFAGGLAISGTLGLAGMMARRPSPAAAPVREATLAIVAEPARARALSARARRSAARAHVVLPGPVVTPSQSATRLLASGAVPTPLTNGVPSPAPVPATMAPAPAPAPVPTAAPQLPAPAPIPAPQPPAAAPVVVPAAAAPVATTHASPPPP